MVALAPIPMTEARDGLGRRIARIAFPTYPAYSCRTDYYYSTAWQVLEERDESQPQDPDAPTDDVRYQYVWDPRYIDALVCRDEDKNDDEENDCTEAATGVQGSNTGDEHLYYTQDANFNVTALVDGYDGAVVQRYLYEPYGQPSVLNGVRDAAGDPTTEWAEASTAFENEILFGGYRCDYYLSLYDVRHRMYHPTLGRWIQRDPIGYVDGMTIYGYVSTAPTRLLDPYGISAWTDRRNTIPHTTAARASVKHHLADTGVRIEGRRAELGPMWDAFDRLKGFQCKGGSPKVAVSESYGSEKYDYNLIRSKLTKTERRVVYNVVERTGPNGPEQVGTFTPRDVVVVDPDRCHIVLWVGHVMNIEDPRSGVPSLTTPETGAGPGGGPYEEFRPTVGFACCFAQASKEAAERMGFDTLPTSVGPQEPLWFLPRDTQALDGEEAAQKYPSVVARLFSDAARKAEEVLCKDRCCKERGIRIDILWGKR